MNFLGRYASANNSICATCNAGVSAYIIFQIRRVEIVWRFNHATNFNDRYDDDERRIVIGTASGDAGATSEAACKPCNPYAASVCSVALLSVCRSSGCRSSFVAVSCAEGDLVIL